MKTLRSFIGIVDRHTVIVTALALTTTFLSNAFGIAANLPTSLIGIAIIFPIVFSIDAAYKRREEALRHFASFRSRAVAVYFAYRDWAPSSEEHGERGAELVLDLFTRAKAYFETRDPAAADLKLVYSAFSRVSSANEDLRNAGVSGSEISRVNQYLAELMVEFEAMRNIHTYRTPISLRAYSHIFLNSFPIVFGPYFAYLGQQYYPAVGYGVAVLYSLVLVSLDNIQEHLEDPFDSVGSDDLRLDVAQDYRLILEPEPTA
jgi:predicted membrane chloride channel (bestrophin family)